MEGSLTSLGFHGMFINDTTEDRFLDDAKYEPVLITQCMRSSARNAS